ncbi:MAG: hypothetical protein AAF667_05535 [Pseudomonadota bacterium]
MKIALHLGATCTDGDALIWSLLKDRDLLADRGVAIPRPRRFRPQLSQIQSRLRGVSLEPELQEQLIHFIAGDVRPERMILSDDSFLGPPSKILEGNGLYLSAGIRTRALSETFSEHECAFFMAIRNPATLLSQLVTQEAPVSYEDLIGETTMADLSWSDVAKRIIEDNSGVPLTIWCDEDTALLWPAILRAVSGVEVDCKLAGSTDIAAKILNEDGRAALSGWLSAGPAPSNDEYVDFVSDVLDEYALPEALEETVDLPGWTEAEVDQISVAYEQDVARLARMEGVTLLLP